MKKFSLDEKVFDVVNRIPEAKAVFIDLGFTHLANDTMYNTVAKVITLRKAAGMHKVAYETIVDAFNGIDVEIEEDSF